MDDNFKFNSFFKFYDPPEGGVQGLGEKLDRLELNRSFFSLPKIILATAFTVVILVAVVLSLSLIKPKSNLFIELVNKTENPAFIKYGYLKRSSKAVSIPANARSHLAVTRVKTSNKNVKFYIVENISN
jgi:hypothetical protein